jgi:hypothetical protein
MLILLETPAGFALFKVLKEGKLSKPKDLWKSFTTVEKANELSFSFFCYFIEFYLSLYKPALNFLTFINFEIQLRRLLILLLLLRERLVVI